MFACHIYRERHKVDGKLAQIGVELAREAEAASDARHDVRHKVVEVTVRRSLQLESAEADVVESFVVNAEAFVGVLNKLVNRKSGVVRLDDSVAHLDNL